MKFCLISKEGDGCGLLHRLMLEGNDVSLWIRDSDFRDAWEGMLPKKLKDPDPPEDSIVIFDFSGMGDIADSLKERGFPVLGASSFADKLELDRDLGLQLMEESGIRIPLTANFDDFSIKLVKDFVGRYEDDKSWYFKPSGEGLPCALTYGAKDVEDLLKWVEYVEAGYGKLIDSFVLQEKIEGVVVSTEMWCNGKEMLWPANHTVEVKAFMDKNLGPSTGCAGNLVWIERDRNCRIVSEGVARVGGAIVESGYVGPIDLNAVVNEEGVFGLEWSPRFGYDAMPTLLKLVNGDLGKFFSDIALGQSSEMSFSDAYAAAVRVSIPPYPLETQNIDSANELSPNDGIPIRGIDEEDADDYYFIEVKDLDGELVHSTGLGVIADALGTSGDPRKAFDRPYELLDKLIVPNKQYRSDLAEVLGEMHDQVVEQDGKSRLELPDFVEEVA